MNLQITNDFLSIVLNETPLLDVRAPVEFEKGAFINSINVPILDDNQRHLVGIEYKKKGNEAAIKLGHELVNSEVKEQRLKEWKEFISNNKKVFLYCFRGGQRSQITQKWLYENGVNITRLKGGFKAFRNYLITKSLEVSENLDSLIIGGRTGSGKTLLLNSFENSIDLEAIANHRGSSFGNFANAQPSQIDFENKLAYKLIQFSKKDYKNLLIEHESINIGRNFIPKELYNNLLKNGKLIILETPLEQRVELTYTEYIVNAILQYQKIYKIDADIIWYENFYKSLEKIKKRLGGKLFDELQKLFDDAFEYYKINNNLEKFKYPIEILLSKYYDPMYDYQIEKTKIPIVYKGDFLGVKNILLKM